MHGEILGHHDVVGAGGVALGGDAPHGRSTPLLESRGLVALMHRPACAVDPAADFRSLGKVAPYRCGDLEQRASEAARQPRAHTGTCARLTYGNEAVTAWIAPRRPATRLASNSLVIVMSDENCKALHRPPWMISCAWSSWDFGQSSGAASSLKRYEGRTRPMEMRRL